MEVHEVKLCAEDKLILRSYETLLEGLENYLGDSFEIVLHSLESFDHSVIKIVNGHHTGRKVGAPITDLALSMLQRIRTQGEGDNIAYFTKNKKGDPLKASTIAIKGAGDRVIGLVCINFYLNSPISALLPVFSPPAGNTMLTEAFGDSTGEMIEQAVDRARSVIMSDMSIPSTLKNRQIIAQLDSQGIFRIKNAVELVAEVMGISKNTVYLHLRHINKGE